MSPDPGGLVRHIGLRSAIALVVANVIGAGIFTTTGFQAAALGDPATIFALWIAGGVLALCGALCYAELGAALPEAGAEYVYLRETYGRGLGFMSAFVSFVAGFPAPIAAALLGLVRYLGAWFPLLEADPALLGALSFGDLVALVLVWAITAVHLAGVRRGIRFNDAVTAFKVGGILAILAAAAAFGSGDVANFSRVAPAAAELSGSARLAALGTSLIFVLFCYTGWNAAAYVASEIEEPQRNLPRALLAGTGIVMLLYLGLNAVYFYGADARELAGVVEVGLVASRNLFGPVGTNLVSAVLVVSLLASASAMTIAGPRVSYALGRDVPALRALSRASESSGAPVTALLVQGLVTSALVLSGRVDQIQLYAGFTLALFSALAVSCVIVLRVRHPELPRPFRTWGYPLTPILFIAASAWIMFWAMRGRPLESLLALATVAAGGILFAVLRRAGAAGD